jgi:hypothetical protein
VTEATQLNWLADAPLFIDAEQVGRFYDAVVRPHSRLVEWSQTNLTSTTRKFEASGSAGGKLDVAEILGGLGVGTLLSGLATAEASLAGKGTYEGEDDDTRSWKYVPIETPQRQLLALTAFYASQHWNRIFLVGDPSSPQWRAPSSISAVPRSLVFLDLPGTESPPNATGWVTMLIPTAAEFGNGKIVPLYPELKREGGEEPPTYPERAPGGDLPAERAAYWSWFSKDFSAKRAMRVVEKAASDNGRIHWIDYRTPISAKGDTLHLHVSPRGAFDTGTFAYNFIKRGYKHGIRIVGTLKSEPDMNVLAIYEK